VRTLWLSHRAHALLHIRSMHYRKSSPNPPRLLLRIVAAAGAGAVVSACSSGSGQGDQSHVYGSAPEVPSDGGEEACNGFSECGGGTTYVPPSMDAGADVDVAFGLVDAGAPDVLDAGADGDAELHCGTGVCGSIVSPPSDAGEASTIVTGLVVSPDGGSDQ
jgi:hypothetical protein